jgi:hypothetical protein
MTMQPRPNLLEDRRGAIVVVAVFMAVFLVGCLWYMIGIGDAVVYRQKVQAAADATAFGSAVYHARGMNMIAMINLNMAALLAILVAAKLLKIMASIVYAGAVSACAQAQAADPPLDFGCDEAKEAGELFKKLQVLIKSIEDVGDSSLKSLSESQTEVARVSPWIAYTRSQHDAKNYEPYTSASNAGAAISMAMVPQGERLGLPVAKEDFAVACERGGKVTYDLVLSSIPVSFNAYLRGFSGTLAGLKNYGPAAGYPPEYCTGNSVDHHVDHDFDQWDLCKKTEPPKKDTETWDQYKDRIKHCVDNPPSEQEKKDSNKANGIPDVDVNTDTAPIKPDEKGTKKIYDPAYNGSDFFQVYAMVNGNIAHLTGNDKGVELAGWGKALVGTPDPLESIGVTQAEYYYDQTAKTSKTTVPECWTPACGMTWPTYAENTLWNMHWRARLRRYRPPSAGAEVNVLTNGVAGGGSGVSSTYKAGSTGGMSGLFSQFGKGVSSGGGSSGGSSGGISGGVSGGGSGKAQPIIH